MNPSLLTLASIRAVGAPVRSAEAAQPVAPYLLWDMPKLNLPQPSVFDTLHLGLHHEEAKGFRRLYGPLENGMTRQEQLQMQITAGTLASVLEQGYVDRLNGVKSEAWAIAETLQLFAANEGVPPTAFKTAISRAVDKLLH
jgi:hypothetical protein